MPVSGLAPPRARVGVSGNHAVNLGNKERQSEAIKQGADFFPIPSSARYLLECGNRILYVPGENLSDGVKVGGSCWPQERVQPCSPHFSRNLSISLSASVSLISTKSAPTSPYSHSMIAESGCHVRS